MKAPLPSSTLSPSSRAADKGRERADCLICKDLIDTLGKHLTKLFVEQIVLEDRLKVSHNTCGWDLFISRATLETAGTRRRLSCTSETSKHTAKNTVLLDEFVRKLDGRLNKIGKIGQSVRMENVSWGTLML